ncbi:hypothetical protein MMPV_000002 [Pyropia vietnamensis]
MGAETPDAPPSPPRRPTAQWPSRREPPRREPPLLPSPWAVAATAVPPSPVGARVVPVTGRGAVAAYVTAAVPWLVAPGSSGGITLVATGSAMAKAISVSELLRRLLPTLSVLTQLRSVPAGTAAAAGGRAVVVASPPWLASPPQGRRRAARLPVLVITLAADLSAHRVEPGYAPPPPLPGAEWRYGGEGRRR